MIKKSERNNISQTRNDISQKRNYISIFASVLILLLVNYNVCCHTYSRNKICLNQIKMQEKIIESYTK